jgi:hypothetical protein
MGPTPRLPSVLLVVVVTVFQSCAPTWAARPLGVQQAAVIRSGLEKRKTCTPLEVCVWGTALDLANNPPTSLASR